ncbi:hypothetical protein [Rhodomicrobium lacus]|uniref:hypothetical protein n=1 Tax=Rhodomicrobium lacus TaxID=2498452 RepID=UPI000F8C778F|nr:hypothetical protein [Rhodomicrobium lacus]
MRKTLFLLGAASVVAASLAPAVPAEAKTIRACETEWRANKDALQATGKKKTEFMTECRAQTASAKPAPLDVTPPAAVAPPPAAAAPQRRSAAPTTPDTPSTTKSRRVFNRGPQVLDVEGQFPTEAEAKAHCPREMVVWANTDSKVYHFPGSRTYGKTRKGAYMCESETAGAGIRVAKNEKRPPIR